MLSLCRHGIYRHWSVPNQSVLVHLRNPRYLSGTIKRHSSTMCYCKWVISEHNTSLCTLDLPWVNSEYESKTLKKKKKKIKHLDGQTFKIKAYL